MKNAHVLSEADKKKSATLPPYPPYFVRLEQNMRTFLRNTTFIFSVLISGFASSEEE